MKLHKCALCDMDAEFSGDGSGNVQCWCHVTCGQMAQSAEHWNVNQEKLAKLIIKGAAIDDMLRYMQRIRPLFVKEETPEERAIRRENFGGKLR